MSSEEGQKHIYAQEHQLYYYYNKFKGQYTAKKIKQTVDSRFLVSCIYFVVLLTTNFQEAKKTTLLKIQKEE